MKLEEPQYIYSRICAIIGANSRDLKQQEELRHILRLKLLEAESEVMEALFPDTAKVMVRSL